MRVLVIDDEPDVLLLCRVNLEFEGFDVLEASDGERGIDIARGEHPDVIILDVMMPRMDGLTVLDHLSHDPSTSDIPVIMLTAKAQEKDQIRGWVAGASDYITKPFSPGVLIDAVAKVASMSREELRARRAETLSRLSFLNRL
ncbi:MAG TPA: response regulator [Actinomycetota bacterium]|nr:response regulator [Actinomycetota bacterium]